MPKTPGTGFRSSHFLDVVAHVVGRAYAKTPTFLRNCASILRSSSDNNSVLSIGTKGKSSRTPRFSLGQLVATPGSMRAEG